MGFHVVQERSALLWNIVEEVYCRAKYLLFMQCCGKESKIHRTKFSCLKLSPHTKVDLITTSKTFTKEAINFNNQYLQPQSDFEQEREQKCAVWCKIIQ